MYIAFLICVVLLLATTVLHYECLRGLSSLLPRLAVSGRLRVLIGILGTFFAHMLEITLYGLAYYSLRDHFDLGNFGGHFADKFSTFLYFSAETFTSVGFGDIYPAGALRMVCGFEALNGLLLIGWSASFTYVFMEHFWKIGGSGNGPNTLSGR
ncbi:MAG TPA: potassium channel family protein [Parasulfuritortus sp.]